MSAHEFLATYPAKLMEYTLAVAYLLLFIPFWRYLQGGRRVPVEAPAAHRAAGATATSWFTLPEGVLLHPGHTWARTGPDGLVEVGLDEFAARMLGPVERLGLPVPGAAVAQGSPAFLAQDGGHQVPLVSPVDGTVAEVNAEALAGAWQHEPYGAGWLFKVRPTRLPANERQLFSGAAARRWLEEAADSLLTRASPHLGAVLADGGVPVHGIARELEPLHWDALCREYFRS
jgi:glycine cleavage system H protein